MVGNTSSPLSPSVPQNDASQNNATARPFTPVYQWQTDWRIGVAAIAFNLLLVLVFGRLI